MITYLIIGGAILLAFIFFSGIRIVRPTERATIETFGRYTGFANRGFNWVIPAIQQLQYINTTERMTIIEPQEIITEDNLNANVDLVVYYKVKNDEESVKKALYEVNNFRDQITVLAQTTTRNVIGTMPFKDVNSKRNELNTKLVETLKTETANWGVDIVRVELKEIIPPKDVQETMNKVIKAENEKRAAIDFATATETQADGIRRAAIKSAEGSKQAAILEAQGKAQAFELINKSFIGNAQLLRKLEVTENSLKNNAKIVLPEGKSLVNVLGNLSGE